MLKKFSFILTAAGNGQRYGTDKIQEVINGEPLYMFPLIRLHNYNEKNNTLIKDVILTCHKSKLDLVKEQCFQRKFSFKLLIIEGGETRSESVKKALNVLDSHSTHVFIHDAARPNLKEDLLNRLISQINAENVIPGIKVNDCIKEVNNKHEVSKTHNRNLLRAIQTPQLLNKKCLMLCYQNIDAVNFFDEAQLLEENGIQVKVIEGDPENFKVTVKDDFEKMKKLLSVDGFKSC